MAVTIDTQTIKDAVGKSINLGYLKDGNAVNWLGAPIWDPLTQQWASVDANGRLKVAASDGIETTVHAEYDVAVSAAQALIAGSLPGVGETHAWVTVDPDSTPGIRLRYTKDGATVPTATVGHTLEPGDTILMSNLANIQVFGQGGAVTIHVTLVHF